MEGFVEGEKRQQEQEELQGPEKLKGLWRGWIASFSLPIFGEAPSF